MFSGRSKDRYLAPDISETDSAEIGLDGALLY